MPLLFLSRRISKAEEQRRHLSYLVHYIATREGVAPVDDAEKMKLPQKAGQLIRQLVQDFPMTKKRFEYEDYLAAPRGKTPQILLGSRWSKTRPTRKRENYVDYIGMRPALQREVTDSSTGQEES
jgi:hypothetical protein